MKVSVVIPCFNVKVYLEDCLNSILNQSLKEIEIICIDDGSNDGTKELLEYYKKRFDNICFICQKNEGAGNARNKGIKLAHGDYIAFMDADDFYPDKDVLECLYKKILKYHIDICGGSICSYRNGVYTYNGFRKGMVIEKDGWVKKEDFLTFAGFYCYLYRRDFLLENNITFPDYKRCQDPPFFLNAISKVDKVYCMKKTVYCYRKEHKEVHFDESKAIDCVKGIRDSLIISKRGGMSKVHASLIKELHGEVSALMYFYAHEGSEEMRKIIHDINLIICDTEDFERTALLEGDYLDEYVEKIWIERDHFFDSLKQFPKILIFGAGTVGRKVLNFLRKHQHEPDAFVVSDLKQNPSDVDGVVVKSLEEYVQILKDCIVIVATFSYLHKEIQDILIEKGFEQFYLIDMEKFYLWCGGIVH